MNLKNHFFERRNNVAKINHEDELAAEKLASEILGHLPNFSTRPIVFVCIGTDRSTGDSLGPLIGTLLQEKEIAHYHVYGTLDDPIHAVNMDAKLAEIKEKHFNPFIIGIDACLGRLKSVGSIQVGNGPVKPGAGVNKELPEVGNMHITGIVNVSGFMEFFVLQNTRLNLVLKMAKTIANGIFESSQQLPKKKDWPKLNWDLEAEQPTVAE